jgi:TPR repeat protein
MRLTASWHRKAAPAGVRVVSQLVSSLASIGERLDGLSRKVERLNQVTPAARDQSEDALETAISGLRGVVAHVASADALESLDRDIRALAETVSAAPADAAGLDAPLNLERRIASIADAIAALRVENRRRAASNIETTIEALNEKIELLQATQTVSSSSAGDTRRGRVAQDLAPLAVPMRNLDSIERGIVELIKNVQEVRGHAVRCAAELAGAEREIALLRRASSVTARRAPDMGEPRRGTIDDLLARMAALERDLRDRAPPLAPDSTPPPEPAPARVPLAPDAPPFVPEGQSGTREPLVSIATSAQQTVANDRAQRRRKLGRVVVKVLIGIGLTIVLASALALLASYLLPQPSVESGKPQAKIADRGARLDDRSKRAAPSAEVFAARALAATLPPAMGVRLIAAATAGDPSAAYEVGVRLSEMAGVTSGNEQAVAWLERAASAGVAPAQLTLGSIYEKGLGIPKDPQRARALYLAAARKGNAKAMHNLAVLNADGVGGKPDYGVAAEWFRKAAGHGLPDSQFNLAVLYERGTGVELSLAEAYRWYALAARQGDVTALRRRDDIGRQLDARTLQAISSAIESFVAEPQPEDSITVKAPPGGWDRSPPEPAKARRNLQFAAR